MPVGVADLNGLSEGRLPGLLGIEILTCTPGRLTSRIVLRPHHLAPNGYLHAGTLVSLADTSCGYATRMVLPEGSSGHTTIELKSNFLATVREGAVRCTATLLHAGRLTQVWDATVVAEDSERTLALVRLTQMVLYPPENRPG